MQCFRQHNTVFKKHWQRCNSEETVVLKKGSNPKAVYCLLFPVKLAEIWWNCTSEKDALYLKDLSLRPEDRIQIALTHYHHFMLQNSKLLNSGSANSLIPFLLLTTHLHNPMLHTPIMTAYLMLQVLWFIKPKVPSQFWQSNSMECQMFRDCSMTLLILRLQRDKLC